MNATIMERRATLFVGNLIKITGENIPAFISIFGDLGLYPSVNKGIGIKVTPNGVEHEDVISLDMKYLDETLKVSIGPERIDIVSKKADENWDSFREFLMKISKEITSQFNNEIVRYAQCASIRLKLDLKHAQEAYQKLFVDKDSNPVEWQLRKVHRTQLLSSDNKFSVMVNNVYNISRNNVIVNGENLSNIVTLDMDVNTLVGSDINSLKQIQELFWVSSAVTIQKAMDNYYSILSDEK